MTRWLSAEQVALLLDKPKAHIYVIAARHQWRSFKHKGLNYYNPHDVRHSAIRLTS